MLPIILFHFLLVFESVSFRIPPGELTYTFDEEGGVVSETLIAEDGEVHTWAWDRASTLEEQRVFDTRKGEGSLVLSKSGSLFLMDALKESPIFSFFSYFWEMGRDLNMRQAKAIEQVANDLLGEFRLFLMGFYPEESEVGTLGKGEISDQIRITAINGILNQKGDWFDLLDLISESHGGVNVHSVYWPSQGWTKDMYKCFLVKSGQISEVTKKLSILWRVLIEEMGGVESSGTILHYAHSIGSLETYVARQLMTEAELKKIKVVTFGAPYLYPNSHFLEVTHYVSYRDFVGLTEPFSFIEALQDPQEHIYFVTDGESFPFDHFINSGTYKKKLVELGAKFTEQYPSPFPWKPPG